mmetsp:Transcript_10410/g.22248  ORF Transcript_10410/g.22248 Transcript_10410/m.22248 type:complete len:133 (-) Transcript_10410:168-566(-)
MAIMGDLSTISTVNKQFENAGAETECFEESEWVQLDMKLIDWSYMDFSRTVQVTTTIHSIKEVIKKWHGGKIARLTVCKDTFSENNELRNENSTLKDIGIRGNANKEEAPVLTLMYDFKPDGCDNPDPILMY